MNGPAAAPPARFTGKLASADAASRPAELTAAAPTANPNHRELAGAPDPTKTDAVDALVIRGRVVGPDGGPIVNAKIDLHGQDARKEEERSLEGTRWTLPEASGRSGVDGRFEIRLAPFPCNAANGDVTAAGFVGASLSFPRIAAGESQDLGDIVLQRGARIHGRVLDRAGKPSPAVWSITARMEPNNQAPPRSDARIQLRSGDRTESDPTTGAYSLDCVPVGAVRVLGARWQRAPSWTYRCYLNYDGPVIATQAGGDLELDLLDDSAPAATADRIDVELSWDRSSSFIPNDGEVRLVAPGGDLRAPDPVTKDRHANAKVFSFSGLLAGQYSIRVDGPRFEPAIVDGLRPGMDMTTLHATVRAPVRGSGALRVEVWDPVAKKEVQDYALAIRWREPRIPIRPSATNPEFFMYSEPSWITLRLAGDPLPENQRYGSIVPGNWGVRAVVPGRGRMIEEVLDLRPGETRPLRVILGNGGTISGRLFDSEGAPVPHTSIGLYTLAASGDGAASPYLELGQQGMPRERFRIQQYKAETDANGNFTFTHVVPELYVVRAARTQLFDAVESYFAVHEGASFDGVEVRFPIPRFLSGTIRLAAGVDPARARLSLRAAGPDGAARMGEFPIAADGTYRAGPLPPMRVAASIRFIADGASSSPGALELGELDLSAPGDLQRDFDARALNANETMPEKR